ncbi:MAG: hypothetical protein U0228_14755 [Myxococcaceae bacterium]
MGLLDRVTSGISNAVKSVSDTASKAVETVKHVEEKAVETVKDGFSAKPAAPTIPSAPPAAPKPPEKHWYSGITDAVAHTTDAAKNVVSSTVHDVEAKVAGAAQSVSNAGHAIADAGRQVIDSGTRVVHAAEHAVDDVKKIAHDAGRVVQDAGKTVADVGDVVRHAGTAIVTGDAKELDAAKNAITRAHNDLTDAHNAVTDARAQLSDIGHQGGEVVSALHDAEKKIVAAKDAVSTAAGAVKAAVHEVTSAPGRIIQGVDKAIATGAGEVKTAIENMPGGKDLLKGVKEYGSGAAKLLEGVATGNPWKIAEGLKNEGKGIIDFGKGLVDSPAGKFVKDQVMNQVNGFNVDKQVKELKPGETYEVKVGADVHVEVGGEAAANLKVSRGADGTYTVNAGGNLGVNGYLDAGGRVNLGVVNGSAGASGSLHGTIGGNLELKCKTPEEAQQATHILEKLAANSGAAQLIASGGHVLNADEQKFIKDHMTGLDITGAGAGAAAASLGLDKGILNAGLGASAGVSVSDTLHIDFDHGKPTGFSIKQQMTLTAEGHALIGVGKPGAQAPGKFDPSSKDPGNKTIMPSKPGVLAKGLQGQITDTITVETHYPIPSSVNAADFQKDPLAAIQKASVELNAKAETKVTINAEGEANVLGKKHNIGATLTFTGKPSEVLNKTAIDKAIHGDLEGASRAAADHVQVEGTMYTYNTQKWGFEGLGGDILGVGVSGTLAASKRHVDDPPLVSWKKTGTEFVEAERRGLQNLDVTARKVARQIRG